MRFTKIIFLLFILIIPLSPKLSTEAAIQTIDVSGTSVGINNGFGDVIGNESSLAITSDALGNVSFTLTKGTGDFNDYLVMYIDSTNGGSGVASTSTLYDIADPHREAISGLVPPTTAVLDFASGFTANYAVAISTTYAGLWGLNDTSNFPFIRQVAPTFTATTSVIHFSFLLSDLGLVQGDSFRYVVTYLSLGAGPYRSDEFHGVSSSTVPAGNPGTSTVSLGSGDYIEYSSLDSIAPIVTVPSDITNIEANSSSGADVSFTVSANDNKDGSLTPSCDHNSGDIFPLGDTTVTCTAIDLSGNTGINSFIVNVVDTTAPTTSWGSSSMVFGNVIVGSSKTYSVTFSDYYPSSLLLTGAQPYDFSTGGPSWASGTTVNITASPTAIGSRNAILNILDTSGNAITLTLNVNGVNPPPDTTAPSLTVPDNITIEATGPLGANVTFAVSAMDNVDGNVNPTCSNSSGIWYPLGITEVTCSATDLAGNTQTGSFSITVVDTTNPTITIDQNVEFIQGTSGNILHISLSDINPYTYSLFQNGTLIDTGTWTNGSNIDWNLDSLTAGYYNFTISVSDLSGNSVSKTVIVHVTQPVVTSQISVSSSNSATSGNSQISSNSQTSTTPIQATTSSRSNNSSSGLNFLFIGIIGITSVLFINKSRRKIP